MHKFALEIFNLIKNLLTLLKVLSILMLMMYLIYWVEHIISANWGWLGIIRPFLDNIILTANMINPNAINLFGTVIEIKYIIGCAIIIAIYCFFNLLLIITNSAENGYNKTHLMYLEAEEKLLNQKLKQQEITNQTQITNYAITFCTKIKPKFNHKELNININEQNKMLIKYLDSKFEQKGQKFNDGYIYYFEQFQNIDKVLDICFKVLKSNSPLDCAICIQINNDTQKLIKLNKLELFGQVILLAETAYRYKFNHTHRYDVSQVGLFQTGEKTIEVHEFRAFS